MMKMALSGCVLKILLSTSDHSVSAESRTGKRTGLEASF